MGRRREREREEGAQVERERGRQRERERFDYKSCINLTGSPQDDHILSETLLIRKHFLKSDLHYQSTNTQI